MSSGNDTKQKKDLKEKDKKFDLGALEEDDDFEEFPAEGIVLFFIDLRLQNYVKIYKVNL